jgi:hypothetical protein
MTITDLRVAARGLARDPAHTLVSVLGLAVGLAFCLLLLGYSRYSWSYDSQVPQIDQVYVLKHKRNWELGKQWIDQGPMAIREPMKSIPGVAEVTGYTNWFPLNVELAGDLRELHTLAALPGFTKMMGIEVLQGDLEAALSRPDAIVLTEAAAVRLFGSTKVLGQTMTVRLNAADTNVAQLRIDAVVRTPPANTTIPYDSLIGLELTLLPPWAKSEALLGELGFQGGYLLVRLAPQASPAEVTAAIQHIADNSPLAARVPEPIKAHAGEGKFVEVQLAPLRDAYMDNSITPNVFSTDVPRGDPRMVAGLAAIGVVLLALAAINYVNLATIRVLRRQREITLRKVLGIGRRRLALQFVAESMLVSMAATFLGLALAALALPAFGDLVDRDLDGMLGGVNLLIALGLGVVLGLLTAIYPAWVALHVRPARLLAGRADGESAHGKRLRQALTVLQLTLAISLASVSMAIALQTRHAMTTSPGFDPARKLVLTLPIGMSARFTPQAAAFITEASQHPAIAGIAAANTPVGENLEQWASDFQRGSGDLVFMEVKVVSNNFFEVHGIAPLAGRMFQSSDNEETARLVVLTAESARILGFASPELAVGQNIRMRDHTLAMADRTVVGVAPAIRFNSLRTPPEPMVYELLSAGATLTVGARGSAADAEQALHDLWAKHFPNAVFEPRPARDVHAGTYADDARLARLLAAATLIAMLIAACGAYVLAADAVARRKREIALRKLFGARRGHIGALVARELGAMVSIAGLIALPLSAVAIARYLAPFLERTPLAYLTLVVALLVATLVVGASAARHAWLAMRMRPAQALRS